MGQPSNTKRGNKYQRMVLDILGTRPIAFNPDLARALGSVTAGLFLCQILYWWRKGSNPEMFYKTVKEFEEETALSKSQQLNAQKICVGKGVLQVLYKGIPPKRHFKIDMQKILELLEGMGGDKVCKNKPIRRLSRYSNGEYGAVHIADLLAHITENTPKITSKEFRTNSTEKRADAFTQS